MPDWTAFGAVAGLVLFLVLGLAWITSGALGGRRESSGDGSQRAPPPADSGTVERNADSPDGRFGSDRDPEAVTDPASDRLTTGTTGGVESIPTTALLANVALTHGGLGVLLLGAAALTGIPAAALGVAGTTLSTGYLAVLGGLGSGLALAATNVGLAASLDRIGVEYSENLRSALAPESAVGWLVLLGVILPLVAGFEELLFRAVLIGVAATAIGASPWLFVVPATVAFALGHGLQGKGGIAVTGLLGGALGVAFVLTNSLLLVVIAHYVVNAVEFLLKEWLAIDVDGRF
ncbi:hypothetical protein GCM10028857_12060 [Salinarchaeum chitinilyticum]